MRGFKLFTVCDHACTHYQNILLLLVIESCPSSTETTTSPETEPVSCTFMGGG
jgi:hypothetical protein